MITEQDQDITPQLAKEYLERNTGNYRRVRPTVVSRYARDMAEGRWHEDTGTIDFDDRGVLGDGQHRLLAIIEANVAVRFRVRYNVPVEVFDFVDWGMKRTLGDLLRHRGEHNVAALAAAANLGWRWDRDDLISNHAHPSNMEILGWIDANPTIRDAVRVTLGITKRPPGLKASVAPIVFYRFGQVEPSESLVFMERIRAGVALTSEDPVLRLRDYLMGTRQSRAVMDLAITIKAWNAWITGAPMRQLSWKRGGSLKEALPVVIDSDARAYPPPFTDLAGVVPFVAGVPLEAVGE